MKHVSSANAAFLAAADATRLHTDHGFDAYPWTIGVTQAGTQMPTTAVIAENSKSHHRWPEKPLL